MATLNIINFSFVAINKTTNVEGFPRFSTPFAGGVKTVHAGMAKAAAILYETLWIIWNLDVN